MTALGSDREWMLKSAEGHRELYNGRMELTKPECTQSCLMSVTAGKANCASSRWGALGSTQHHLGRALAKAGEPTSNCCFIRSGPSTMTPGGNKQPNLECGTPY